MHVGLNLIFLVPGESGGMETAARALLPHLAAQEGLRLTLFVNREAAGSFDGLDEVVVPVNATNRLQWVRGEQELLPRLAGRAGCDLVHSLGSTAPLHGGYRRVTTIHDLNYLIVPEAHFGLRALGMRVLVPAAARRSHRVIAVSEATRRDLVELLRVPAEKIDVVPHGASAARAAPTPAAELRARLALGEHHVLLCVGGKRPHKNVTAVLDAIAGMQPSPVLVVTGYRSPYEEVLRERAATTAPALRITGVVSQEDLEGLYAIADCVVVPSLYEGFGLPVLEAMARGVPVVCSDRSSLPEVAGDAAILVDPADTMAIRRGIQRALADPEPLRAAGRVRAAQFTWQRAARLTAEAYRRA